MNSALPPGVIYNGPQNIGGRTLMVFTDSETGHTFTVSPAGADYSGILAALITTRMNHEYPSDELSPTCGPA